MPDLHSAKQMDEFSDSEASEFVSNESEALSMRGTRGMAVSNPGYHGHPYSGNADNSISSFQIHDVKRHRCTEDHVVRRQENFANMAENEVNSIRKLKVYFL